jgi:hypothetical protein
MKEEGDRIPIENYLVVQKREDHIFNFWNQ